MHVKTERTAGGADCVVTVDNERRLNCLSTPTIVSLAEAFARLGEDKALRAVVLTGAGEAAPSSAART